jgi:hypothetical protein
MGALRSLLIIPAEKIMPTPVLLPRAVAAARLQVSERTVRRWGVAGRLDEPHTVRVTEESVERLINAAARGHEAAGAVGGERSQQDG